MFTTDYDDILAHEAALEAREVARNKVLEKLYGVKIGNGLSGD